jgi:RNA polymerase sigma-70 factor, ECF subfamily
LPEPDRIRGDVNVNAITMSVGTRDRAKRGDLAAFEALIRTHERSVFRLAWRLLGNVDDAADVAQEVFLKLYRNLDTLHEERDIGPWLYRVTVNAAHDVLRKRRPSGPAEDVLASPEANPEQALAADQRQRLARRAIELLPPRERAAVVLRDIEGLSTAEVAAVLGSTETTVRSQLSSARVKLKRIIDGMLSRRKP